MSAEEKAIAMKKWNDMDEGQRRSTKGSLKHFRSMGETDEGASTKGEGLINDCLKWIDYSAKVKSNYKQGTGTEGLVSKKIDNTEYHRWGKETIYDKIGPIKGQSWIDSNLLAGPLPDMVTGKRGEFDDEWIVPKRYSVMSLEDFKSFKISIEAEMGLSDLQDFREMQSKRENDLGIQLVGAGSSSSGVKQEAKTDDELLAERLTVLLDNVKPTLLTWQEYGANVKDIVGKGTDDSESCNKDLLENAKICDKKVSTIVRVLQKMISNTKDVDSEEAKKLLKAMDSCDALYNKVFKGGVSFGYVTDKKKKARKS